VPFLATDDPYHLEELQFMANFHPIGSPPGYRGFDKGLLMSGQTRAYAWGIGLYASAVMASKPALPSWFLPQAYWTHLLENNRLEFDRRWVKNGDGNPLTGLHLGVDLLAGHISPWQQDMLGAVLGWVVRVRPEWMPQYAWQFRQAVERTNGSSGIPRSRAIEYFYDKVVTATSWANLSTQMGYAATSDDKFPSNADDSYKTYLRANLKIGVLNNQPGAAASLDYVEPQVPYIPMKWAI
jgi:hypothetical protein